MKIVIDDKIPFIKGILEPFAEVLYIPGAKISAEDVKDANALIVRTRTKVNADLLEGSSVQYVATATIGFDHIDRAYLAEKGIGFTNCPGCNADSVRQYFASAVLFIANHYGLKLTEMTLGVVGAGNVGSRVAKLAEQLGMKVLVNDPPRAEAEGPEGFCDLDTIKAEADFVSFHTPYITEGDLKTHHLLSEENLSEWQKQPFIMNTCRGEVTCNKALKLGLQAGDLRGAIIDVWENEPAIDRELMGLCDLVTPHIAGYSADGKSNGTSMSVQAVAKFFDLPLKGWYPADVPVPDKSEASFSFVGDRQVILQDMAFLSYDISKDDRALRSDPSTFEYLRGHYPLRREYPVFKIALEKASDTDRQLVEDFGFQLV